MSDNTDAKIAREWAEKIDMKEKITFSVDEETLAAAHYILATAPMPQMSDMEWDNSVHAGLCAEHPLYGVVRMLEYDHMDKTVLCYTRQHHCEWSEGFDLTPLPGTRVDLTPRREQEPESTPEPEQHRQEDVKPDPQPGEAWLIEYRGKRYEAVYSYSEICDYWTFAYDGLSTVESTEATPVSRLVPERAPSHPTVLTTEADYRNAPEGTIVAAEGKEAWTKGEDGSWETWGIISGYNNYVMADGPRRVLRWGWEA